MNRLVPAAVLVLIFLVIVGLSIYETVDVNRLSLPTAKLAIPTLILPFVVLASTLFTNHSVAVARRQQRNNPNGGIPLRVALLQLVPILLAVVLATFQATVIFSPADSAVGGCLLENAWKHLYSNHDGDSIRRIQDAFNCCGFNSPRDRSWPFPRGSGSARQPGCEETLGRHSSCRAPWSSAMRTNAGVELAIIVLAQILQIVNLVILRRGSASFREATGWTNIFGQQNGRQRDPTTRPLLGGREELHDEQGHGTINCREERERDANGRGKQIDNRSDGPRLEPSLLGSSETHNEWANN